MVDTVSPTASPRYGPGLTIDLCFLNLVIRFFKKINTYENMVYRPRTSHMARGGHGLPKVHQGPACPTLLLPAGGPPLKQPYGCFRGCPPTRRKACGCLLPLRTPHAVRVWPRSYKTKSPPEFRSMPVLRCFSSTWLFKLCLFSLIVFMVSTNRCLFPGFSLPKKICGGVSGRIYIYSLMLLVLHCDLCW
jgi:hypothetical protein